jgi:hypothetical protein
MEYLEYDYKNVKTEINFENYEKFIWSRTIYKYYLKDLALMRYDPEMPEDKKKKADLILKKQKIFFALPYPIVFASLYYYKRRNLFKTNFYLKEMKVFLNLFIVYASIRIFQKCLLKYEGDKLLVDDSGKNI